MHTVQKVVKVRKHYINYLGISPLGKRDDFLFFTLFLILLFIPSQIPPQGLFVRLFGMNCLYLASLVVSIIRNTNIFMKTVPSVYILLISIFYLSHSTQVQGKNNWRSFQVLLGMDNIKS